MLIDEIDNRLNNMLENINDVEIKDINKISNEIDNLLNKNNVKLSDYLKLLDKSILIMELV